MRWQHSLHPRRHAFALAIMLSILALPFGGAQAQTLGDILDPVLDFWERKGKPDPYPSGTWGPESADKMLARDGRTWRRP